MKLITENYELAISETFSEKSLDNFEYTNKAHWVVTKNGKSGKDLKCYFKQSDVPSKFFPSEVAFIANETYGDFIVEFNYMQKSRDFSIRDICILFGYQDSTHYYFAQAASQVGKYNHCVFKVDGDRPVKIGKSLNKGVVWNYQKWHKIVVIRKVDSPKLEVYIDDELVLESTELTGGNGKLGFGTYGSGFKIDNLKVWKPEQKKEKKG